ncbi:MAG: GNAT family N-acetyltransferase [Bacteroidia bacterium]
MATTPPLIRPIRKTDNAAMATVIRKVMTEFGAVGEGFSIMDAEVNNMYEAYSAGRAAYFITEVDGLLSGGAGIGPLAGAEPDICELKKMYLLKEIRGMGLGKALLHKSLQAAKELGYKRCYLETLSHMVQANKLYQAAGFEKIIGPLGNTGHHRCETFFIKQL